MQKITSHLWFDNQAEEAVQFYTGIFKHSSVGPATRYTEAGQDIHKMPPGSVMVVEFELEGSRFMALNGGPVFKFTPAVSFLVACETVEEVDELWKGLSEGGTVMMELAEYPYSKKYGWCADKYGISWQIMCVNEAPIKQKITPTIMFVGDFAGRAEEAMNFYVSVFKNSAVGDISRYGEGHEPDKPEFIAHASFTLEGQQFAVMDSAYKHDFTLNEAISFLIQCDTDEELDHYWEKLNEGGDPKAQQCGWLKDKYGVSWQVAPKGLEDMLRDPDQEKVKRLTDAFMKMKKLDRQAMVDAFEGK